MENWLSANVLVSWLQQFVRYRSEQTALQEREPRVLGFIKDCVAPLMSELQLEHRLDAMGNLIFEAGPRESGRSLLFVAYAMTHPAANMPDPFSATLIDTTHGKAVRGRGVAEQKSALTAALGAVTEAVKKKQLRGRLIFTVVTAGETGRHDAVERVMADIDGLPQQAIICVGTSNKVAIGNKGRVDFDITIKGKASHSSTPWNGVNALNGAWRILEKLERFELKTPAHPQFGPATLTATAVESRPKATHTIQDTVRITCDRRLLPGEDPEEAYQDIASAITLGDPWKLEWTRGPVMCPNEISVDSPIFAQITKAFERAVNRPPVPFYCNFALDAGLLGKKGIEAVMLGPGDVEQFHSDEEYVLVPDLTSFASLYHKLIESCLT